MANLPFNIVAIDNLARDYNGGKSEWLIGAARDKKSAELFARAWNDKWCTSDTAGDYAVVRPASEPLYVFEGY